MESCDLFLSYPHIDQESVRALAAELTAAGLTVWMDVQNVEAFDRIHDRVAAGIANSRAALVWYSRPYAASRACQWELAAALLAGDGERVLVVNPESDDRHIQPRSLLNRHYLAANDVPSIARAVKGRVARFPASIGTTVSFSQPLHYGRQLTGSNHFVGRIATLWDLHDALSRSGAAMLTGTTRSVAQLRGFGGVGKSVLAEEYGLRFGAAYPGGIFWLKGYGNEHDRQTLQPTDYDAERDRQIGAFASQLHVSVDGKQPAEIRAALAQVLAAGERSLWIVDDVESGLSPDDLSRWLSPHASVPTLITTRDRSHSSLGVLLDVDVLSLEESFTLFEAHRPVAEGERRAAQELLDALGRHALAVEIAASYLADQQSESIEGFLTDLRNPNEDVLEQAGELADALPLGHSPSIVATLNSTIGRLSEPGRDLLCLASFLATAPIPKELIEAVSARVNASAPPKTGRMKAAKETDRYGLSRRESAPPDALSVHALVARTARRHAASRDRLDAIHAAAVASLTDVLRAMFSLGTIVRQSLVITHARAIASQLATPDAAELLVLVANTDLNRGDLESAERLARRALDYCSKQLGDTALGTCRARSGVAMVHLSRGESAEARRILEAVIPVFDEALPPGDVYRVGAQLGLALSLAAQGDLASARRLSEAALSGCIDSRGADHLLTLNAKTMLGQICRAQGYTAEGTRLQQEVIDARLRLADKADVDTLADEFVMAQARIANGEITAVAPIVERAATVFEQTLGEDNVLTLNAQLSLLLLLSTRREAEAARRLARDVIPRFERIFGARNPATLQARLVEAGALIMTSEAAQAAITLPPIVVELERVLGAANGDVVGAKVLLAQALYASNDFNASRRVLEGILPASETDLGPEHPSVVNAKTCLAACLCAQGDRAAESRVWEDVIASRERSLGNRDAEVLTAKVSRAQALFGAQQYQDSVDLMNDVIPIADAELGPDHDITTCARVCFAIGLVNLGNATGTLAKWDEILLAGEQRLNPSDPALLSLKLGCAQALFGLSEYERGRDLMLAAIPVAEGTPDAGDLVRNMRICLAAMTRVLGG